MSDPSSALLSLLRGGGGSTNQSSPSPRESGGDTASIQSESAQSYYQTPAHSTNSTPIPQFQTQPDPNFLPPDLDRLFKSAFNSPHPDSSNLQTGGESSSGTSENGHGLIERPAPFPIGLVAKNDSSRSLAGRQSNSLLELLQQFGAPSSSAPGTAPTSTTATPPSAVTVAAAEPEKEEKNVSARDLFDQLMGGSLDSRPIASSPPTQPLPPPTQVASLPAPPTQKTPFTFVSPFDLLAATSHKKPSKPVAPTSSSSSSSPHPSPAANRFPQASLPSSTPKSLLARSLLSSSIGESRPTWAPRGVRPPSQQIEIVVTNENREWLDIEKVDVTAITLFGIEDKWDAGRGVGRWEAGFGYSTRHGKIRVIDRQSGAKLLLKGHSVAILDLAVSPAPTLPESSRPSVSRSSSYLKAGVDVTTASTASENDSSSKEQRIIASSALDGRLVVWSVPDSFAINDPLYEKLLDSQDQNGGSYTLLRFHPHYPEVAILAAAKDGGEVVFIDLSGESGEKKESLVHESSGEVMDLAFSPDGTAFSVLTKTSAGATGVVVRHTTEPTSTIWSNDNFRPSTSTLLSPSSLSFLTPTSLAVSFNFGTQIEFISIPSPTSTFLLETPTTISFLLPAENADSLAPEANYAHMRYDQLTQTLYVSSSLRGSLWAFGLEFSNSLSPQKNGTDLGSQDDEGDEEKEEDAELLERICGRGSSDWIREEVRVRSVLEIPTPEKIVDFVLDYPKPVEEEDTTALTTPRGGAVCVHPNGIHQVSFTLPPSPKSDRSSPPITRIRASSLIGGELSGTASRRRSLEGSIHVVSEVEVAIDNPVDDTHLLAFINGENGGRRRSLCILKEPAEGIVDISEKEEDNMVVTPGVGTESTFNGIGEPEVVKDSVKLDEGEDEPVNGDLGLEKEPEPRSGDLGVKLEEAVVEADIASSAPSPATPTPSVSGETKRRGPSAKKSAAGGPTNVVDAWAAGSGGVVAKKLKEKEKNAAGPTGELVLNELKRIEESLPTRLSLLVAKEMDKQAQKFDEDRAVDKMADTARQENLLKLVSTTLSKNTSKLVDTTIRDQIRNQVVPAVGKIVQAAVADQIAKGVALALDTTLPFELEKLLSRPDLTAHVARSFSTSVGPALERSLSAVIASSVLPSINQSVQLALDTLMKNVRQEMTEVRKEIVREQSDALDFTEQEVHALRADVSDLKAALERMESIVLSLRAPPPPPPPPPTVVAPAPAPAPQSVPLASPRQQQSFQQPFSPPQQQTQSQAARPQPLNVQQPLPQATDDQYALPPIPRPDTPEERYEDIFINVLQPEHAPEFPALLHIIKSSPAHRLDVVFPRPPLQPRISAPVIHSLALRLGQIIEAGGGVLDEDSTKQLIWLRKSLTALDGKDEKTALFTPRIIENVIASLSNRGKQLSNLQDRRGAEAIRAVEQYARSRLALFSTQQTQQFRR